MQSNGDHAWAASASSDASRTLLQLADTSGRLSDGFPVLEQPQLKAQAANGHSLEALQPCNSVSQVDVETAKLLGDSKDALSCQGDGHVPFSQGELQQPVSGWPDDPEKSSTVWQDEAEERANTRRVIASSIIGNTLEWYDFLIFIFLGSVISRLFFPKASTYARMLLFLTAFAAGFITRPLGAILFGYIGDKYGRKVALTWSIYLMSVPTALVGCLPTYEQAGLAAPILLFTIRVLQGFAVGGEFTSTMVFLVEHAPPHQRGLQGSWAFFSVMVGVITGSAVAMAFNFALSDEALYAWGWRVPFLISILGSVVGIYIRKQLKEPKTEEHHEHVGAKQLKNVALAIVTVVMIDFLTAVGFYLTVIFLPLYYQDILGLSRTVALTIHTSNMVVYMLMIPLGGWLADRYGQYRVMAIPCAIMVPVCYPAWCLFKTGNTFLVWLAQAVLCSLMAVFNGVLPAAFVSLFPPKLRCTGLSIGHNFSMAGFGGTAPIMATAIMRDTGDIASPAALMIIAAALSVVGAFMAHKLLGMR